MRSLCVSLRHAVVGRGRDGGAADDWGSVCSGTDPITLEPWSEVKLTEDVVTIRPEIGADSFCNRRDDLVRSMKTRPVYKWGRSGADRNVPYYKHPMGSWVDAASLALLEQTEPRKYSLFQLEFVGREKVGTQFGVSRMHGTEVDVYRLLPLASQTGFVEQVRRGHVASYRRASFARRARARQAAPPPSIRDAPPLIPDVPSPAPLRAAVRPPGWVYRRESLRLRAIGGSAMTRIGRRLNVDLPGSGSTLMLVEHVLPTDTDIDISASTLANVEPGELVVLWTNPPTTTPGFWVERVVSASPNELRTQTLGLQEDKWIVFPTNLYAWRADGLHRAGLFDVYPTPWFVALAPRNIIDPDPASAALRAAEWAPAAAVAQAAARAVAAPAVAAPAVAPAVAAPAAARVADDGGAPMRIRIDGAIAITLVGRQLHVRYYGGVANSRVILAEEDLPWTPEQALANSARTLAAARPGQLIGLWNLALDGRVWIERVVSADFPANELRTQELSDNGDRWLRPVRKYTWRRDGLYADFYPAGDALAGPWFVAFPPENIVNPAPDVPPLPPPPPAAPAPAAPEHEADEGAETDEDAEELEPEVAAAEGRGPRAADRAAPAASAASGEARRTEEVKLASGEARGTEVKLGSLTLASRPRTGDVLLTRRVRGRADSVRHPLLRVRFDRFDASDRRIYLREHPDTPDESTASYRWENGAWRRASAKWRLFRTVRSAAGAHHPTVPSHYRTIAVALRRRHQPSTTPQ